MDDFAAFAAAEFAAWTDATRASDYVDLFATAADQLIEPLLEAAGALTGRSVLDLCCGQGNVAEALSSRGCQVTGADFSPAMLALARRRVPDAAFIEADAQTLPMADGAFDIVVSNVGICHVPDQRRALSEIRRVLRRGGQFAMTVWCGPDRSPSYEMFYRAIKMHGAAHTSMPPGPDFHQFADREIATKLLSTAGFTNVEMRIVESGWTLSAPEIFFDIFARGTVRAAMLLASQPPDRRAAIRSALSDEVRRRFADGTRWRVPTMAAVLSAAA